MKLSRSLISAAIAVMIFAGAGCGGKDEAGAPPGELWKPTGSEGNIMGTISFTGQVPGPRKMEMSQDPACEKMGDAYFDDVVVNDGKLQNVFIYVKTGLPKASFEIPSTEPVLDQKGCRYVPRVLGLQTNQGLKITNSDPTDHDIRPTPKINRQWNQSQLAGQGPIVRKFPLEEVLIPVKCNKHPWMLAYIGVISHPFYSVSGADGTFSIKGLPPGEYEIEAWHEKYGARTAKVTVAEKADAKLDFSYDGATAYRQGGLKLQPAIVMP